MKSSKVDLLNGNLYKTIIKLAYPIAIASTIQMLYNLADTFWLGKLGREALSAPIISFQIIFFLISLAIGFSIPATSLVAQYLGAKKEEMAKKTAGNILLYLLLTAIFFTGIGLIFQKKILLLLGTPKDTFQLTYSYMRIILWGLPMAFPFFVFRAVMNGYGDSKSPLKIEFFSIGLNLFLDPILIFGWFGFPKLGVEGAAFATIFARCLSSGIGLYWMFSGKRGFQLKLQHLKPDKKLFSPILKIGTPAAIGMSGTSLGFIIILAIVNKFGTTVVSAYGITSRVIHLYMMPCMGISQAITAIVGQNLGAEKNKRAEDAVKKGAILAVSIIVIPVILTMIYGQSLLKFFIPQDPAVHQLGTTMFLIITPSLLFFALITVFNGAFTGSGYTIPVMTANLARIWIFRLPLIYIISMVILGGPKNPESVLGIWWGMFISNFLAFLMILFWYTFRGLKQGARISEQK